MTPCNRALAEESAWLKATDHLLASGYEPVMVVFRDARGELETFSVLEDALADVVAWLATGTPSRERPEPEQ